MKPAFILAIFAMGLLVACGGGGGGETLAPTADNPAPTAEGSSVENTGPIIATLGPDSFFVGITGDVAFAMSQDEPDGRAVVQINADGDVNLQFATLGTSRSVNVTFKGNSNPTSGTYQIADWEQRAELEDVVVADVSDFTDPEYSFMLYSSSGTITLNVDNGIYSGNFEFAARGETTTGIAIGQATVIGSFNIPE